MGDPILELVKQYLVPSSVPPDQRDAYARSVLSMGMGGGTMRTGAASGQQAAQRFSTDENVLQNILGYFPGTQGVPSSTSKVVTNAMEQAARNKYLTSDPNVIRSVGLPNGLSRAPSSTDPNILRSLGLDANASAPAATAATTGAKSFMQRLLGLAPKKSTIVKGTVAAGGLGALSQMGGGHPSEGDAAPAVGDTSQIPGYNPFNTYAGDSPGPWAPEASVNSPEGMLDRILKLFGAGGMGGGGDTQSQLMNAQTNRLQYEADKAYKEAQVAIGQGDQQLARDKFAAGEHWSQLAAESQIRQDSYGQQNANTSRQNANTNAYEANVKGVLGEYGANTDRANAQTSRMNGASSLVNILGDLAARQGELQLKVNSTPKNAIAGLLMSRGQTPDGAGGYRAGNVLGFDPNSLLPLIQSAMQAFQQPMPTQPFNLQAALSGIGAAGAAAQQGLPPERQPAPLSDPSGLRVAGNRTKPIGQQNYDSVYERMVRGGAPQMVLDQYKQASQQAGFPTGG